MEYNFYNNPEIWLNGFYELSIEYHPFGNKKRLNKALNAMCKCDFFNGLWREKKDFHKHTITLPINIEGVNQFYGTLSLSKGNELPCMVSVISVDGESDWLDLAVPLTIFEKKYPFTYPLTKELNPWLYIVDEVYTELAEMIFHISPFDFAMIGEEISGYTNQEEITVEVVKNITCILPTRLQNRLGLQDKGRNLSNGLRILNSNKIV